MAFRIGRFFASIAPEACPMCEGGSGLNRDANRAVLRRCAACGGSGLANSESLDEMQHRLDAALFQSRRTPEVAARKAA